MALFLPERVEDRTDTPFRGIKTPIMPPQGFTMAAKLTVLIIGTVPEWCAAVSAAIHALHGPNVIPINPPPSTTATLPPDGPWYAAVQKARTFLTSLNEPITLAVHTAATLANARANVLADAEPGTVGMVLAHATALLDGPHQADAAAGVLAEFYDGLDAAGVPCLRTPYSDAVFIDEADYLAAPFQNSLQYRVRVTAPHEHMAADVTVLLTNYLQHIFCNRLARRRLAGTDTPVVLGPALADCMRGQFGDAWILSYYTGSVVSGLIKSVEDAAGDALVIRGPSEHALACAAFIHARLYQRGWLLLLTSAMIDELKGTLANLQQLRARGLIVCADATESKWFGFQATVNSEADIRGLLTARKIPWVYLQDPEEISAGVAQIAAHLAQHAGPVVLIATQAVLEARRVQVSPTVAPTQPESPPTATAPDSQALAQALALINHGPERILWQCGALTPEERDLSIEIAEAAGIALADSLSAPGFMPAYRNGQKVAHYLGMLGQYGTNQEVFRYLMNGSDLRAPAEQCLFVLKGKLGQIDSPFSDADHARRLRIVKVNAKPEHIGAFADIGLGMRTLEFLQWLRPRVALDPGLRERRMAALAQAQPWVGDVLSQIPTLPMTPNFFHERLRSVVEKLITEQGYRYVGLFDVGHNGTLAVGRLPRTGPCYSGWYGRGLMGDSLQAAGALVSCPGDSVLAVSGDGAKQITPDILPGIVENLSRLGRPNGKNVTIFYLVNNAFSIINSYVQRLMFKDGGRQMTVINPEPFAEADAEMEVCGTLIRRRRLLRLDEAALAADLTALNRVNIFTVPLINNDDGISVMDVGNWQYG